MVILEKPKQQKQGAPTLIDVEATFYPINKTVNFNQSFHIRSQMN